MLDILVYLVNPESQDDVHELFSGDCYNLTVIDNLKAAAEACQEELFDVILVWEAQIEKLVNFVTLLEVDKFDYEPVIAVIKEDEPEEPYLNLNIVDLIKMPVNRQELFCIIDKVVEDIDIQNTIVEGMNWNGSMQEYNLIDLIQMIEKSNHDAELIMIIGEKSGQVYFHKGKVINAKFMKFTDMEALKKLVFWPNGNFQTKLIELENTEDKLGISNQEILMSLVEALLKQEQLYQGLPELVEDIVKNPLVKPVEMSFLQNQIADHCQNPTTIFDLLISLKANNEDILRELKVMMEMGLIGEKQEVESKVRRHEDNKGFGKIISSISSIFKKKDEPELSFWDYEDMDGEILPPILNVKPLILQQMELDKIDQKLNEVC